MTTPADQDRRNRAAFDLMHEAVLKVPAKRAAGMSEADIEVFLIMAQGIAEAAKSADVVDDITALRLGQL